MGTTQRVAGLALEAVAKTPGGRPRAGRVTARRARRGAFAPRLRAKDADENRGRGEDEISEAREQLGRQYLDAKLEDARKDVEEACANPTSKDCAIAWDSLDELNFAANRKNEQRAEADKKGDFVLHRPSMTAQDTVAFQKQRGAAPDVPNDFPCDVSECSPPGGSLFAAGRLERSLGGMPSEPPPAEGSGAEGRGGRGGKRAEEIRGQLVGAIEDAFETCGDGTEEECSAAWDQVEDLSLELDREEGGG